MTIPPIQIGVMGSAHKFSREAILSAYAVGKTIAECNCTLITGATTGVPYAATLGSQDNNGLAVGISPAGNPKEHTAKYKKPLDGNNAIIYTGMGYNGREPINIASCDGIIYIAGEFGTLIEFGQGFYEGKVLGVLTGVGGISNEIKHILSKMNSSYGSIIIYDDNPAKLVKKVIDAVMEKKEFAKEVYESSKELGSDVREILSEVRR